MNAIPTKGFFVFYLKKPFFVALKHGFYSVFAFKTSEFFVKIK